MYLKLIKKNRRMSTCNQLELQSLEFEPVVRKNLPDIDH